MGGTRAHTRKNLWISQLRSVLTYSEEPARAYVSAAHQMPVTFHRYFLLWRPSSQTAGTHTIVLYGAKHAQLNQSFALSLCLSGGPLRNSTLALKTATRSSLAAVSCALGFQAR